MPTNDNVKLMARVPVIPDDYNNKSEHKLNELLMDFTNDDIWVLTTNGYVNITGRIKEEIGKITAGSCVVHIVTEDTLPPVTDREKNHWYYVVTRAEESGRDVVKANYVYYGLVTDGYDMDINYLLLGQNMVEYQDDIEYVDLNFNMDIGFNPVFYVPISITPSCTIDGNPVPFTNGGNPKEIIYAMNTVTGQYVAYKVWVLDTDPLELTGEVVIRLYMTGSNTRTITFHHGQCTYPSEAVLPAPTDVQYRGRIGTLPPPTWTDGRFSFKGYSLYALTYEPLDPEYTVINDINVYAWWEYNDSPDVLLYTVNELGGEG